MADIQVHIANKISGVKCVFNRQLINSLDEPAALLPPCVINEAWVHDTVLLIKCCLGLWTVLAAKLKGLPNKICHVFLTKQLCLWNGS